MTGDQGTLDSSLTGGYLSKASNYGPAIFKAFELVSLSFIRDRLMNERPAATANLINSTSVKHTTAPK